MNLIVVLCICSQPFETNPVNLVIGAGISVYQSLISESQGDVCNFYPSCSHFAREACLRYGVIWGSLMTADRLMRCNPWAYKDCATLYPGIRNNKIYDPVERNFLFKDIKRVDSLDTSKQGIH